MLIPPLHDQLDDVSVILDLIRALAIYEKEPDAVKIDESILLRDGFDTDKPFFHAYIAEWIESSGEGNSASVVHAAGFALYFYQYSTWEGRVLYLEDIFIKPEYRKKGLGSLIFRTLAAEAQQNDCCRFQWQVLYWNTPSIEYFQSTGAKEQSDWRIYRLDRTGISSFLQRGSNEK
jgi:GNAT superfamily N-acetyltransferase